MVNENAEMRIFELFLIAYKYLYMCDLYAMFLGMV